MECRHVVKWYTKGRPQPVNILHWLCDGGFNTLTTVPHCNLASWKGLGKASTPPILSLTAPRTCEDAGNRPNLGRGVEGGSAMNFTAWSLILLPLHEQSDDCPCRGPYLVVNNWNNDLTITSWPPSPFYAIRLDSWLGKQISKMYNTRGTHSSTKLRTFCYHADHITFKRAGAVNFMQGAFSSKLQYLHYPIIKNICAYAMRLCFNWLFILLLFHGV